MKEDFNIEELFQEHFKSFESDVETEAWSNIQQSIQAGAGASSGIATWVKGLLIGAGISAAVVGGVYLATDNQTNENPKQEKVDLMTDDVVESTEKAVFVEDSNTDERLQSSIVADDSNIEEHAENAQIDEVGNDVNDASVNDLNNYAGVIDQNTQVDNHNTNNDSDQQVNNGNNDPISNKVDQTIESNSGDDEANPIAQSVKPNGALIFEKGSNEAYTRYSFESMAENHVKVSWDFGDGKSAEGHNITHTYQQPGNYTVTMTVSGKEGVYVETVDLEIIAPSNIGVIPNIFSPNNDGRNDHFVIQTTGIKTFVMIIQDKNGQNVFETTDPNFEWDGTDPSNAKVPSGYYNFIIKAVGTDGKEFVEGGALRIVTE